MHPEVFSIGSANFLELKPLTATLIPAAVELDQRCLGGLWTLSGYQRELESPNSDLLVLQRGSQNTETQSRGDTETDSSNASFRAPPPTHYTPLLGLGCLWAIVEEAHITMLAIDPSYQRQGLGQALLYALLVAAWRRRLEWATLEVRVSNQSALALYQKFGFEEVGRRRRYYQDTGEDALILWHRGLQKPEFRQKLQDWQGQVGDRLYHSGWSWVEATELSLNDPA